MEIKPGSKAHRFVLRALVCLEKELFEAIEHCDDDDVVADNGNDLGYVTSLIKGFEAGAELEKLGVIEITPEMIEAGAEAITSRYGGLDLNPSPSAVAMEVFSAMLAVCPTLRKDRAHTPLGPSQGRH